MENLRSERSNGEILRNEVRSDSSNSDGDSFNSSEDYLECVRDMMVQSAIEEVELSRYLFRQPKYRDKIKFP